MFSAATKTGSQPSAAANYIEDVFSTYLYTGNGSTQTINNGINLNVNPNQVSLVGYTLTNLGGAFNSSYPMARINDGIVETTNASNIGYVDNTAGYFDVYVDMTTPTTFVQINIAPQGTENSAAYNTPADFIVKASNNASTWTTIATFTGISTGYPNWNAGTFRAFSFTNSTAYRYWRFENTSHGSAGAGVTVSELRFSTAGSSTGKNGLVWLKSRSAATNHFLFDTTRGTLNEMNSNTTDAQASLANSLTSFNSNGFSLGSAAGINVSAATYCSWTFAQQPKFFDIVTYTGTGSNTTISHNLGSVPGMIIVKRTDTTANWQVYHRSLANTEYLVLNSTAAKATGATRWNSTTPTSTEFSLGTDTTVNASGGTYVAYLFAHDAGGFGTTGTDNVISCGTFTADGTGNASVNLGFEPQYLMVKSTTGAGTWLMVDVMRGYSQTSWNFLGANSASAETPYPIIGCAPNATGFTLTGEVCVADETSVYMAIRRPMKVPTDATTVFQAITASGDTLETSTATFPLDMQFNTINNQSSASYNNQINDRLRGIGFSPSFSTTPHLTTATTAAESTSSTYIAFKGNGMDVTKGSGWGGTWTAVFYNFARRPGFFDEVCYTGTGSGTSQTHNLGVIPELKIIKRRSASADWIVGGSIISGVGGRANSIILNSTAALSVNSTYWDTADTSTTFSVRAGNSMSDGSGSTYAAYLFATCAGVSKVGSYTGNGTTQAISCGFTGGARFVLIKRTDDVGDWYVYDTARGMTTLTDPYLLLNSTAAESATLGSVTTTAGGFTVNASILAAINTNAASYIFLAIA